MSQRATTRFLSFCARCLLSQGATGRRNQPLPFITGCLSAEDKPAGRPAAGGGAGGRPYSGHMRTTTVISNGCDGPQRHVPSSPASVPCACPFCHASFPITIAVTALAIRPIPTPAPMNAQNSTPPLYAIRKGLRAWSLTYTGLQANLVHEQGLLFVASLLLNPPPQPIHALDLIARIPALYPRQARLPQLADGATGQAARDDILTRLQEPGLARDDAEILRSLVRKERVLEAILDSETEIEPVKQEALRDLEAIAEYKRRHARRSRDNAVRAADNVRKAINRFHSRLERALDFDGRPHPVLRPFAEHIRQFLLHPRTRCPGGCFIYEPPEGVVWRRG